MVNARMFRNAFALALFCALAMSARADVIMDWNARADAIATEKRLPPPMQGRALAMMHVAMFEAVNSIERRYVPYRLKLVADRNTSRETAAASGGARCAACRCIPTRSPRSTRVAGGNAEPRGRGIRRRNAASSSAAKRRRDILELRSADGSEVAETYRPFTQPGVYVPTALPVASTVSGFTPWVMASAGAVPSRAAARVDLGNLDARRQ